MLFVLFSYVMRFVDLCYNSHLKKLDILEIGAGVGGWHSSDLSRHRWSEWWLFGWSTCVWSHAFEDFAHNRPPSCPAKYMQSLRMHKATVPVDIDTINGYTTHLHEHSTHLFHSTDEGFCNRRLHFRLCTSLRWCSQFTEPSHTQGILLHIYVVIDTAPLSRFC